GRAREDEMRFRIAAILVVGLTLAAALPADEGMWPYNNVPVDKLKAKYGWAPDAKWLDHVRLSSVRFNSGGSRSFVSAAGFVRTNHPLGPTCIQKLPSPGHD